MLPDDSLSRTRLGSVAGLRLIVCSALMWLCTPFFEDLWDQAGSHDSPKIRSIATWLQRIGARRPYGCENRFLWQRHRRDIRPNLAMVRWAVCRADQWLDIAQRGDATFASNVDVGLPSRPHPKSRSWTDQLHVMAIQHDSPWWPSVNVVQEFLDGCRFHASCCRRGSSFGKVGRQMTAIIVWRKA